MAARRMRWILLAWLAWSQIGHARAADPCDAPLDVAHSHAARIVAVACAELRLWYSPFIDADGRLASTTVAEAESARLRDGLTPAWRRVADYWRDSGLLGRMASHAGAADCAVPQPGWLQQAACRAYVLDTPWSAAFVSYVMARAGLPGFTSSASHVEFVRRALRDPTSPYRLAHPEREAPAQGDLLCYSRAAATLGQAGLESLLRHDPVSGLPMHCDIVVAVDAAGGRLQLVGGNVLQAVSARLLNLNRNGRLWDLPKRAPGLACVPGNAAGCSFNRQDWVALLKLKPLPAPTMPMPADRTPAPPPSCCVRCVLPMPAGTRRCPAAVDQ